MNFTVKKMVKKLNIVNGFRKTISYVLIFSLLWQNCLWATHDLYTIEEELGGSRVRTYSSRRAAIVEPGTIRDNEIHNVFEDFQLLDKGGVVFTGAPDTTKIYNRIYSTNPIHLSGVVEADYPLPMVFTNPGGIVLENPDFQNVHDLTLAAGALAKTNEGMAYGVDEGSILVNQTVIREQHDVKNLALAGREIRIQQSLLSPAETLILRAGQHVKGWHKEEGEWVSKDYLKPNPSPLLERQSIFLDASTILISKGLYFESLEEGTEIRSLGVLQSTDEDIIIRAKGDVYLDKLFAHRNLKIKTTGRVFLGNQTFVGGSVKIKAAEIINQGKLIGAGKITFDGLCKNNGFIKTQGILDTKNFKNEGKARVEAKSIANPMPLLSQNLGSVDIQDDLKLDCGKETLKGAIKIQGKLELSGQDLTIEGNVTAQKGIFFKGLKTLTTATNGVLSALGEGLQGAIGTLVNNGKTVLSVAKTQIEKFTNSGLFSALGEGFHGTISTLKNSGKMDFSAVNLRLRQHLTNEKTGAIRTAGHFILQGEGKTLGINFSNFGKIFTCGIHQINLPGTYEDHGTLYAPALFLLDAADIKYTNRHQSYLKDGLIRAKDSFTVDEGVGFFLNGNMDTCSLQLSSQNMLRYNGQIKQWSSATATHPLLDYYKIFGQNSSLSDAEFSKKIRPLSSDNCQKIKGTLQSGVTLQAKTLDLQKTRIQQDNGSIYIDANSYSSNRAKVSAGYFTDNNVNVHCRTANLKGTALNASFGHLSFIAKESSQLKDSIFNGLLNVNIAANDNLRMDNCQTTSFRGPVNIHGGKNGILNSSSFSACTDLSVSAGNVDINASKANSKEGSLQLQATQDANIHDSAFGSRSLASLIAKNLSLYNSDVKSRESAVQLHATHSLKAENSDVMAPSWISLMGEYVHFKSSDIKSQDTVRFGAKKSVALDHVQAEGTKGVNVTTRNLTMNATQLQSARGSNRIQVEEDAKIRDCTFLSRLSGFVSGGGRVDFDSSHLISQEEGAHFSAKFGTLTDSSIRAKGLAVIIGEDLLIDSSTLESQEKEACIHAANIAKITNSDFLAQYAVAVNGRDVTVHSSTAESQKDKVQVQGTHSVDIKDSDILGKLLVLVSGENVSVEGRFTSQEDAVHIQATKSAKVTGSQILGRLLTSVMGEDVSFHLSNLTSQEDSAQIQATNSANITGSTILAKLLAFVGADDVSFDSSKLSSQEDKARIEAKNSARITASILLALSLASVIGKEVTFQSSTLESQEDMALIVATRLANILQSTLKGKTTGVDGGENLTISESTFEGEDHYFKADNINSDSDTIKGKASYEAKAKLDIHNLKASGAVTALAPTMNLSGNTSANAFQGQGKHIKIDGTVVVETFLNLIGEVIEHNAKIKAGGNLTLQATECYGDNENSLNEAGGKNSLIAPKDKGFNGNLVGDTLEIVLRDMNLFDLLNQTQARITKAHLAESDVSFNENFVLNRTLELWGKSLKNKAKFTATKDFIAHMQTLIMNEGSMVVQGDMTLESQGLLANYGLMKTGGNFNAKAETVVVESRVERKNLQGRKPKDKSHKDEIKSQASIQAEGNAKIEATGSFQALGAKFEAKLNIGLKSAGALYLGPQQLESEYHKSGKKHKIHRFSLSNHKTKGSAGKNVDIKSGEGMLFEGVDVKAGGYIHVKSKDKLENITAHNISEEKKERKTKGGFFKSKKTSKTEKSSDKVVSNNFTAEEDVRLGSVKENVQQATHIKSGGATTITSEEGKVIIKADKSSKMHSTQKSSKSMVWQSQQQKGRYDEAVKMLEILAKGGIHISGALGIEAEVKGGKRLSSAKALDLLETHKETEWVKGLRKDPKTTWKFISEEHKKWNQKTQGLTGPAAAVISIAIAIATQGVGAGLISGLTTNATVGAMSSAAFTSLVSKASISLISNKGDIGKTLKEMGSKEYLRSFATSMARAALLPGGSPDTSTMTFMDRFQYNLLDAGKSAAFCVLVEKQDVKAALLQAAKGAAIDTVAGWGANQIKAFRDSGAIDNIFHKVAHGALGAGMGTLLSKDPAAGALAGGIGAMVAETVAEAFEGPLGMDRAAMLGRLAGPVAAFLARQDVDIASYMANNAITNNFLLPVMVRPNEEGYNRDEQNINDTTSCLKEPWKELVEFLNTDAEFLKKAKDKMLNEVAVEIKETREKLGGTNLSVSEIKKFEDREKELLVIEKQISKVDVRRGMYLSDCIQGHQAITAQSQPLLKGKLVDGAANKGVSNPEAQKAVNPNGTVTLAPSTRVIAQASTNFNVPNYPNPPRLNLGPNSSIATKISPLIPPQIFKPAEISTSIPVTVGKRYKNRLPDQGKPGSIENNPAGTTIKKYGNDGHVQKEFNKGHGDSTKIPKNERNDHVHDYKPNPHHPAGTPLRQPGRPVRNKDKIDFNLVKK